MNRVGEPRRVNPAGRRVFVHVGSPKSGTTGVQDVLWRHRDVLAEHGVHYPADRFDEHFLAALDLQQLTWGGLEGQAVGVLDRLVERVRSLEGTVILSSEVFAAASTAQAERLLTAVDGEVHVVFSARDLARQIPAEWQELVKHRHRLSYADLLDDLSSGDSSRPESQWFWSVQHWPGVLERWGAAVPPERVHVVTVPPRGADRDILTGRFWQVFGIDPRWLTDQSERTNVGLDSAATTALRRLNERLPGERLASRHYRPLVREAIVHRGMTGRSGHPRVTLPPDHFSWVARLTQEWVTALRARGYDVVGDLDELAVNEPASQWHDPDRVPAADLLEATEEMLDLAVCSSAELLEERNAVREERDVVSQERDAARAQADAFEAELAAARSQVDQLWDDIGASQARSDELDWLRQHPAADVKRRVVDASERHPSVRSSLALYRAVRDRTRRSGQEEPPR